ncbi:MAG: fatty acid--CoA ligase family protein [Thermodesulfobacteriota bacterium]
MYERTAALLENRTRPFTVSGTVIGEIGERAAGIRDTFSRLGTPADEPVCLCIGERASLLAALLASMAGGPPLVLPHAFQPGVLSEIRAEKPFRLILADGAVEPPEGAEVIRIEACRPGERPLTLVRPPDEAFVFLFTGGSTGKSRLWSKTPANLLGEAMHLARTFGVGPADRIVSTVPPQHIYGLLGSVLLPFVARAQVLERTCTFPREILQALQKEEATVLVGVPIHYRALRSNDLRRFSLRLALSSAAPLDDRDAAFFLEKTGLAIREIYGSTETGGMATRSHGAIDGAWTPYENLEWKLAGDRLCVRSAFLSPDLPRDADGYFMTADRVAKAGEKAFTLLGRSDHIVKVAGKRVDLEGVREKIRQIPGVRDAHVTAVPVSGARQSQIAALVAGDLSVRELREAIRAMDESYGRPRRIRIVRELPFLPNGKIDRQQVDRLLLAPGRS